MEIKNSLLFSATKNCFYDDTTIWKSIIKYWNPPEIHPKEPHIHITMDNKEPLSKIYNEAIDYAIKLDSDCLILVHDDVTLEEDPIPKLEKLFDDYDLVGVAGASKVELKSPALWHLMGGGFQGGNLHGCVKHYGYSRARERHPIPFKTEFGPYPHRAVMIDGVFMALNRKAMETVRFDENNPSPFHFYDILLSLDACFKKMKVGVGDILITHESPGLNEFTDDWKAGEKYLFEKYSEYYGNILTV